MVQLLLLQYKWSERINGPCGAIQMSRAVSFPLLPHKHYIEHLSNSSYRFIEENYIAIIIVIEL